MPESGVTQNEIVENNQDEIILPENEVDCSCTSVNHLDEKSENILDDKSKNIFDDKSENILDDKSENILDDKSESKSEVEDAALIFLELFNQSTEQTTKEKATQQSSEMKHMIYNEIKDNKTLWNY